MKATPLTPNELQAHITDTYFALRRGLVAFSLALPIVLLVLGARADVAWQPSLSHYYAHGTEGTRDWLVGSLFAVGAILYLYKGFSPVENWALNVAGLFLTGVAWFPCQCGDPNAKVTPHGFLAVSFFLIMAFVVIHCAPETLDLMQDTRKRKRFAHLYKVIAGVLFLSPIAAFVANWFLDTANPAPDKANHAVFLVEAFGIYTFAAYWFVKSRELETTEAETLAAAGRAQRSTNRKITRT